MKLLLSGEGKTDLGHNAPGDEGWEFQPGPMTWIVNRLMETRVGYSLLELHGTGGDCVRFVNETDLAQHGKSGPTKLAGIKYGRNTGLHTRSAQILGLLAKTESGPVIAILFRDGDGNHSASVADWQAKFDSISRGFKLAEFASGVPMVPRPKSEAWLLCALQGLSADGCSALEDAPGNDNSPNSLKQQLAALIGHEPSAEEQAEWVESGRVDPDNIRMPSFNKFRETLDTALNALGFPLADPE